VLLLLLPAGVLGQSISELESLVSRFVSDAETIYRYDEEGRTAIWEAYCGKLDPGSKKFNERFAAEVGLNYQQRERDEVSRLLSQVGRIAEMTDKLQKGPDKDKASNFLEKMRREEKKLQELDQGVVLKGSNHPFTQYAIEYGKSQHKSMCGSYGEDPRVCDKSWPSMSGRPDLVFVDGDGLWIYEFKPDNSDAKSAGEEQVREYLNGVQQYYQNFFPKGRTGEINGSPDSGYGGRTMVEKIKNNSRAWSSDGMAIQARTKVVTYSRCDKRF
jgi:hypothetical protein